VLAVVKRRDKKTRTGFFPGCGCKNPQRRDRFAC
jgi:hypothetical protein